MNTRRVKILWITGQVLVELFRHSCVRQVAYDQLLMLNGMPEDAEIVDACMDFHTGRIGFKVCSESFPETTPGDSCMQFRLDASDCTHAYAAEQGWLEAERKKMALPHEFKAGVVTFQGPFIIEAPK